MLAIVPELIILVAASAILLIEPFLKADRTAVMAVALTGLFGSIAVSLGLLGQNRVAFAGMLVLSDWAIFFKVLFAAGGALTLMMSSDYLESQRRHIGEYYALLLFAIIGMDLMAAARDLMLFYVSLELMAISSYLLAAFFRYRVRSNESSLKYLLTGSFTSAIMLYGISLVYGQAGATNYAAIENALRGQATGSGTILAVFLVAIGLAFKVSSAPFHMWVPDVYEGAPTPIAGFFSVGPKAAAFSVILAAFIVGFPGAAEQWGILFIVLSILTMLVGNLFALVQTNVKRMLAYSSIAHAGYLLAGVGAMGWSKNSYPGETVLIYLAAYTFINLGAFGVLAFLKSQVGAKFDYSLKQMAGLGRRSPWAGVLLSLFMISLTGIPGTAGFIAKFYLFGSVVWANLVWLAVIGVLLSAVSAYYYLRVVIVMFFKEPEEELSISGPMSGGMAAGLGITAFATLRSAFFPGWLWDSIVRAFGTLFS
ncbi:MAG: NADH-quinone oxidoreductase subunit N [Actinobacteria bacterium]|nr:NADH-quinone oxidoreductase subunit N [Actinomycetota bacterium]